MLKNEHTILLGQIDLLETHDLTTEKATRVLHKLLRDSQVHFNREGIVFEALGPTLGTGVDSLRTLENEHGELNQTASTLLQQISELDIPTALCSETPIRHLLRKLTTQFRSHIQHEEKVVYVLVRTRLSPDQQKQVAQEMLAK